MPSGFQRGTNPAKIPSKARRRSEDRNIDVESGSEIKPVRTARLA